MRIYQQVGHNAKWNVDCLLEDSCGDGLILSPVHQDMHTVSGLSASLKRNCLFDPQFYLPSSQKAKLQSYPFFPEKFVGGFDTINFESTATAAARSCVEFQLEQEFRSVVIPARFLSQMYSDFIERHERFSLLPFLEALQGQGDHAVTFTLPLTSHMIEDVRFRTRVLNWITKYPEIDDVYLLYCEPGQSTKQIASKEFLIAVLTFCSEIRRSGLGLVVGYQNTESLLFSLVDAELTLGTFENTRIFSLDKFLITDEERRGPKPRIFLPGLLNWVQFDQAKLLREHARDVWKKAYAPTDYAEMVFSRPIDPYFNQAELYKHQLLLMSQELRFLGSLEFSVRLKRIEQQVDSAMELHDEIARRGIAIDRHGSGSHLPAWKAALEPFRSLKA